WLKKQLKKKKNRQNKQIGYRCIFSDCCVASLEENWKKLSMWLFDQKSHIAFGFGVMLLFDVMFLFRWTPGQTCMGVTILCHQLFYSEYVLYNLLAIIHFHLFPLMHGPLYFGFYLFLLMHAPLYF
ncbi:hypothetical protein ACJX0J_038481, partial [Zea mays]